MPLVDSSMDKSCGSPSSAYTRPSRCFIPKGVGVELAVCARQETNLVEQLIQFFEGASSENALGVSKVSTRAQESVHVTRCAPLWERSSVAVTLPYRFVGALD